MTDLFLRHHSDDWLDQIFAVMALSPAHTFQVLTKRPDRMLTYLTDPATFHRIDHAAFHMSHAQMHGGMFDSVPDALPLPNVWLGVSAEDQPRWDERVGQLLQIPAAVRFVSVEPLLGPVVTHKRLAECQCGHGHGFTLCPNTGGVAQRCHVPGCSCPGLRPQLNWVIIGGESGPHARPCNVEWVRSLVTQCQSAGVAVFVKQLGGRPTNGFGRGLGPCDTEGFPRCWRCGHFDFGPCGDGTLLCNGCDAAWDRLQDSKGGDPDEWPLDVRLRQFPEVTT
jgi:protein gp37